MARPSLTSDECGTSAVEFALVAPILLALLAFLLEAGRSLWFDAALDHAARTAARCAGRTDTPCPGPRAAAREAAATLERFGIRSAVPPSAVTILDAPCGRELRLILPYRPLIAGIGGWTRSAAGGEADGQNAAADREARACIPG